MKNERSILSLAYTAKTFSCRPSSFITGLSGYEAYCLDSACALFLGLWEQQQVEESKEKGSDGERKGRLKYADKYSDATKWL